MRYRTVINGIGSFSGTMDNSDSRADAFQRNGLIEVRRFPEGASDWIIEDVYVIRSNTRTRTGGASSSYQRLITGFSLMWMLRTATVIPDLVIDLDGYSRKNGFADHVAKDYVRDQIGVGALPEWQFPELAIAANLPAVDAGNNVSRAPRYDTDGSLLDLVLSIGEEGDLDFWMEWTPPTPGGASAEIRFRGGTFGTDRTEITNLAAGTPYFIFGPLRGNIIQDELSDDWRNAVTVTFALGAGTGQNQEVQRVPAAGLAVGSGRWDTVASVVKAQSAEFGDTTALLQAGNENNANNRPQREVSFRARQTDSARYGVHYFMGDLVTYDDPPNNFQADFRIRAVEVFLRQSGETVNIDLQRI